MTTETQSPDTIIEYHLALLIKCVSRSVTLATHLRSFLLSDKPTRPIGCYLLPSVSVSRGCLEAVLDTLQAELYELRHGTTSADQADNSPPFECMCGNADCPACATFRDLDRAGDDVEGIVL